MFLGFFFSFFFTKIYQLRQTRRLWGQTDCRQTALPKRWAPSVSRQHWFSISLSFFFGTLLRLAEFTYIAPRGVEEWSRWSDVNGLSKDCDKKAQLFLGAAGFPIVLPVYISVCDSWIESNIQHLLTSGGVGHLKSGYTHFSCPF